MLRFTLSCFSSRFRPGRPLSDHIQVAADEERAWQCSPCADATLIVDFQSVLLYDLYRRQYGLLHRSACGEVGDAAARPDSDCFCAACSHRLALGLGIQRSVSKPDDRKMVVTTLITSRSMILNLRRLDWSRRLRIRSRRLGTQYSKISIGSQEDTSQSIDRCFPVHPVRRCSGRACE